MLAAHLAARPYVKPPKWGQSPITPFPLAVRTQSAPPPHSILISWPAPPNSAPPGRPEEPDAIVAGYFNMLATHLACRP